MFNKEKCMIEVRNANKDDLESIIQIEQDCFPVLEACDAQTFYERFHAFGDHFLVAVDHRKVIGFINGSSTSQPLLIDELYHDVSLHIPDGDYMTVFGLDVSVHYRHQGIASMLMKAYIQMAKDRHKKGIVLTCKDHLIAFYESFGFMHQGVSASNHGGVKWNDMLLLFNEETELVNN